MNLSKVKEALFHYGMVIGMIGAMVTFSSIALHISFKQAWMLKYGEFGVAIMFIGALLLIPAILLISFMRDENER